MSIYFLKTNYRYFAIYLKYRLNTAHFERDFSGAMIDIIYSV